MIDTDSLILTAAAKTYEKAAEEVKRLREIERLMIASATADKAALPNNHWHERYRAEERMRAAYKLMEALT